jgi:ribonuclease HI
MTNIITTEPINNVKHPLEIEEARDLAPSTTVVEIRQRSPIEEALDVLNPDDVAVKQSPLEERLQGSIEKIRAEYFIPLVKDTPVTLFVDGLCENPGAMAIGLFARQGEQTLFTHSMAVGYGTCNEAEYIALKNGLAIMRGLYPNPEVPITVCSDSQLVTKQIAGVWRSSDRMQSYCLFLRKLRKTYPFELKKIPRTENEMADSLAQQYILKHSGRCVTWDQGRFNPLKQQRATVKKNDIFKAVLSKPYLEYLKQHNLHAQIQELIQIVNDGNTEEAKGVAREILEQADRIFATGPKTNEMGVMWLTNTRILIRQSIDLIMDALNRHDVIDFQYIIEELSGAEATGSEIYASQANAVCEGLELYQEDTEVPENDAN